MKKIVCLLILCVLLFSGCGKKTEKNALDIIKEKDILTVGVSGYSKPCSFISKTTKSLEGFDIDVARYVAKDLIGNERKINFVKIPPNKRIEAITSGQVDMVIATMSVTPQRQYFVDFSVPYYVAGQTAVVKEDSDIHTFSDLRKKTTIVVLGTTAEQNIRRIIPTAKIIGYKDYHSAFEAFKNGKGDAVSTDDTIITGFLMDNKGYRMLKNRISQEPYAIGIKQYEDKKLKANLDVIINRMKKDGTLKTLKEKWHLK